MASNVDLEDIFHCRLCVERYDLSDRKPKILDCGHTNCLECLTRYVKKSGRICPQCRQPFAEAPFFIKDNFLICPYLEVGPSNSSSGASTPSAVSQRFYCKRCEKDASDSCLMLNHDVGDKTNVILQRAQDAKLQAKKQFDREAVMLKDLTATLESLKAAVTLKGGLTSRLHRELDEAKKEKEVLDKTTALVESMPGAVFQDNDDIPRALDHFLQENSVRLFALEEKKRMLDMAKKCTLTVSADESGVSWGGKLSLDENGPPEERILCYLIYLLLLNQQNRQNQPVKEPSAGTDGFSPSAPPMGDGKEKKEGNWVSKVPDEASLEDLIANVKKCVLEGNVPDVKKSDDDNDDDDDDSDDSVSVISDATTVPDICNVSKKLFVGKIPQSAKPHEIKDVFSKFGKINYVRFLTKSKPKKEKGPSAPAQAPKYISALVYVPDDFTIENILRNRPIAYFKKGEVKGYRLNVQEDRSQKKEDKAEAKKQRRQRKNDKKNPSGPADAGSKRQETPKTAENLDGKRIFVNQVPLDVTEKQLQDIFAVYGHVTDVSKRRHGVGQKCMAFVTFKDEKSVGRAMSARPIKYYGEGFPDGFDLQVREFRGARAAPPPSAALNSPGYNNITDTMVAAAAATSAAAQMQMLSALQQLREHNAASQPLSKPQPPPRPLMQPQHLNQNQRPMQQQQNQRPMQQQQNQRPMQQQQNQKPMQQQQNQKPMQQQQNQKPMQQQQNQRPMQQQQNQRPMQQQQNQQPKQQKNPNKKNDDNQCSIM